MVIVFFDIGAVFIFVLILALLVGQSAANLALHCLLVLCVMFALKSIICNLYCGMYKRKGNAWLCITSTAIDILREYLFYQLIRSYAFQTVHSVGLAVFSSIFDFIIVCVLGGLLFFVAELPSVVISMNDGEAELRKMVGCNGILTLIFVLFYLWQML